METLILLGLAALVAYLAVCCWWPFVSCPIPHCKGGKVRSPSGKAFRRCWWCRGKGERVRWGRRLYEAMTGRRKHT